ncbi:hypothetical protein EC957_004742 [Mortierella hygrophila]|uniref:F-box domain-containing protein n=1 Tax=Mortierella hygrophila TaxID=979708 RepID=A0A9P6FER7_9FUNG|nr:hypothetical protein EC957_004742 [Mortierella hygrophila]
MTSKQVAKMNENKNKEHKLMIPEILMLIASYLPLFDVRDNGRYYHAVDIWDPKPLLRAATVCKTWRQVFTSVLWRTYDLAIMENIVPLDVLHRNIHLVRNLSLFDKKHKKHAPLWDALQGHEHIEKLEVHEPVFPVKKLLGPKNHNLGELKLSGTSERMHPFLMIFVERQVHLKSLELTRFKFTASDWKRIISNKPHLLKLTIAQQCEFIDHKSDENQDNITEAEDTTTGMKTTVTGNQLSVTNNDAPTSSGGVTSGGSKKRKNDENGGGGSKKRRRAELVNTELPDARNIGTLSVTHLVLQDNLLLLPFHKAILEACPHLEQLEICYSLKADGGKVATLVRDNCSKLRRLTLKSTRQPWTLEMIDGMPHTVEELTLHTGQLDLQMAAAINAHADELTRLELDFGRRGTKGKRRLTCILSILRKCTELREFSYHNHATDKVFKEMMLNKPWNLPNLRKLHVRGVSPRTRYKGLPQVPVPRNWRQEIQFRNDDCCNTRCVEDVPNQGDTPLSPHFDVALLNHIKDLPNLSEVIITEAKYRKRLG